MTSHQDVDENVKSTEFQDAGLLQQEELDSIMETLQGMESKFKSTFQEIDDAFQDLNIEINEGNGRFNGLVNEIRTNFDDIEGIKTRLPFPFCCFRTQAQRFQIPVSNIFQPPPPPPPPRHYKVQNLFNVRFICKPKCEMKQVTSKILCYLFRFIRNEARQSLIIILIKPTS